MNNGIFVAGRKAYGRDDDIPSRLEQFNLRKFVFAEVVQELCKPRPYEMLALNNRGPAVSADVPQVNSLVRSAFECFEPNIPLSL